MLVTATSFVVFMTTVYLYLSVPGGYHLRLEYANSKMDRSCLRLVSSFSPDEAVKRMKEILLKKEKPFSEPSNTNVQSQEAASSSISGADLDVIAVNNNASNNDDNETSISSPLHTDVNIFQRETLTNHARANLLNDQDLVHFDIKSKVFTVRSLDRQTVHALHMSDRKHVIRCSCPSIVENCVHGLAVRVYLGIVQSEKFMRIH